MRLPAPSSAPLRVATFFFLLLLTASLSARVHVPLSAASLPADLAITARQSLEADAPRVPLEFNINSGGPAVGRFTAESEQWIIGRTSFSEVPSAVIGGAEKKNEPMYKSHRYGTGNSVWGYDIPVMEPGTYGCTVHFAETDAASFGVGKRVFDIVMATSHGDPVTFEKIDIFDELNGAKFTVLTKTAVDLVIPGVLAIRAVPREGDAILSGITCERTGDLPEGVSADLETDPNIPTAAVVTQTSGQSADSGAVIIGTEINFNAGGPEVGRFLAEDLAWIFGSTSQWGGPMGAQIGGAERKNKPALISHRYGLDGASWGYRIPVEISGVYDCSVHFAETDSASFERGARVFHVQIMEQVMKRIDVFAEAGMAPFTSVVKTFVDLKVGNELFIELTPVTGNAFLSAITCEKTGELDPDDPLNPDASPNVQVSESPENSQGNAEETPVSDVESSAAATPLFESPAIESPSAETPGGGLEEVFPSPTPSMTMDVVTVTPAPDGGLDFLDMSPQPSVEDLSGPGEGPPATQVSVALDNELTAGEEQKRQDYKLRGKVSGGDNFTAEMKEALLSVSKKSTSTESTWALINLREERITSVTRQDGTSYQIDVQALHRATDFTFEVRDYTKFVQDGGVNMELQKSGIDSLAVELREDPEIALGSGGTNEASTTSTSTVVGIVVGCVLGLLVIVAVGAFVVVRRNRSSDPSANDFDGPPPAMTESEMSSVMERSETANSIEYLDDDSTFTAATSRAGDHVDQVAFDKDVFGRGTATNSHGVS